MHTRMLLFMVATFLLSGCSAGVTLRAGNQVLYSNTYEGQRHMAQQALRWERQRTRRLERAARDMEYTQDVYNRGIPLERCRQTVARCVLGHYPEAQCDAIQAQCDALRRRRM